MKNWKANKASLFSLQSSFERQAESWITSIHFDNGNGMAADVTQHPIPNSNISLIINNGNGGWMIYDICNKIYFKFDIRYTT